MNTPEQTIREIWASVLEVPQRDIEGHSNFFELGGWSALAMEIITEINDACDTELDPTSLVEFPTFAEFVAQVQQGANTAPVAEQGLL